MVALTGKALYKSSCQEQEVHSISAVISLPEPIAGKIPQCGYSVNQQEYERSTMHSAPAGWYRRVWSMECYTISYNITCQHKTVRQPYSHSNHKNLLRTTMTKGMRPPTPLGDHAIGVNISHPNCAFDTDIWHKTTIPQKVHEHDQYYGSPHKQWLRLQNVEIWPPQTNTWFSDTLGKANSLFPNTYFNHL